MKTPEDFCHWLWGFFELTGFPTTAFTAEQTKMVRDHLALVFTKVTPPAAPAITADQIQGILDMFKDTSGDQKDGPGLGLGLGLGTALCRMPGGRGGLLC